MRERVLVTTGHDQTDTVIAISSKPTPKRPQDIINMILCHRRPSEEEQEEEEKEEKEVKKKSGGSRKRKKNKTKNVICLC